jgi:hypothetical protein
MFGSRKNMTDRFKVVGMFRYLDDLLAAIYEARSVGLEIDTVFTPTPHHQIREALGMAGLSSVRFFTLAGGILGFLSGVALAIYTFAQWKFVMSGKPPIPYVPLVIVGFEFTILFACIFNVAGMLIKGRMPRIGLPREYDTRYSEDRFGIVVLCAQSDRDSVAAVLAASGAEEVHEVGD